MARLLSRSRLPGLLLTAAVGVEWGRALVERLPSLALPALFVGGLALGGLALLVPREALGLSRRALPARALSGGALAAVLLLPAAARSFVPVPLTGLIGLGAAMVAAGEEIAFRGALYAALRSAYGPAAAVVGSTAAFTAAHALSHPPRFLLPVAGLGLLLGLWRWAFDDLLAPIVGHVVADLAL